jgi:hypothetical protein
MSRRFLVGPLDTMANAGVEYMANAASKPASLDLFQARTLTDLVAI